MDGIRLITVLVSYGNGIDDFEALIWLEVTHFDLLYYCSATWFNPQRVKAKLRELLGQDVDQAPPRTLLTQQLATPASILRIILSFCPRRVKESDPISPNTYTARPSTHPFQSPSPAWSLTALRDTSCSDCHGVDAWYWLGRKVGEATSASTG
ncbi:hypothetical protein RRG08_003420 [Elysia crispata]|uniref:Uncharacterized protein n=1 Tax=Elysia crispata TaxID=231223 RepID=A0AAE1ABN2_9GAST|nr:hypothetical protein RRG08_003420 [Elysia crispata]